MGEAAKADDEPWDAEAIAFERHRLVEALEQARGINSEAARLMGMPRSTFCSKLKKHGLLRERRGTRRPAPRPGPPVL